MQTKDKQAAKPRFFQSNEALFKSLLPLSALALVFLVNCFFTKNFLSITVGNDGLLWGTLILIGRHATPVIIMALAMTLVIATKGIDLSVGAVAAISGVLAAVMLYAKDPLPIPVIVGICLGIGVLAGLWNGMLVTLLKIQPFMATLILMVAGRGIAQIIPKFKAGETEGAILTLHVDQIPIHKAFCDLFNGGSFMFPNRFYLVAAACLLTWFLARKTVCGTYVEAVGSNETAAKYCGINASLVKLFVYAFSGLCAALAGLLIMTQTASADGNTIGLRQHNELDVILAVIMGGTAFSGGKFNLFGSLVGALTMRMLIFQVESRALNEGYSLAMSATVVVVVCLIQSPVLREWTSKVLKRRSA